MVKIAAGIEERKKRTKRLCRAAERNTLLPSVRPTRRDN
jgi:hypothetical protein